MVAAAVSTAVASPRRSAALLQQHRCGPPTHNTHTLSLRLRPCRPAVQDHHHRAHRGQPLAGLWRRADAGHRRQDPPCVSARQQQRGVERLRGAHARAPHALPPCMRTQTHFILTPSPLPSSLHPTLIMSCSDSTCTSFNTVTGISPPPPPPRSVRERAADARWMCRSLHALPALLAGWMAGWLAGFRHSSSGKLLPGRPRQRC